MIFDPYHKWLGIPSKDQPPNHYRLLGIDLFEPDPEVIDAAANRQMAYLQQRATGEHAALSQKLLNEVAAARLCLLDLKKKSRYDEELKEPRSPNTLEPPASIADPLDGLESVVPEQSPVPMSPVATSRRSWKVEPWHVAVVIGVVFLVGLGVFAVLSARSDATTHAEVTPAPHTEAESTESGSKEVMDESSSGDEDETTVEAVSGSNKDDNATKPEDVVYNVAMSPASADLQVEYGTAVIEGAGRNRQIRVEDPRDVNNLCIVASCDGYKSKSKYLYPGSSEERDISFTLEVSEPEEVVYTVRVSPPEAKLHIRSGEATIGGSGSYRTVRLSDGAVRLEATCDGYVMQSRWLTPSTEETRSMYLSLEREISTGSITHSPQHTSSSSTKVECENMTIGGTYAGRCSSPFAGVALFCRKDCCSNYIEFTTSTNNLSVRGACSNSRTAEVTVIVNGKKVGTLSFSGTSPAIKTLYNVYTGTGSKEVRLTTSSDTGVWDAFVDYLEIN